MDPADVTKLIDELQTGSPRQPRRGPTEKVADLKAKIQTLSPDEQAQVKQAVAELKERA